MPAMEKFVFLPGLAIGKAGQDRRRMSTQLTEKHEKKPIIFSVFFRAFRGQNSSWKDPWFEKRAQKRFLAAEFTKKHGKTMLFFREFRDFRGLSSSLRLVAP
ncbi:MAG: hypothetical protein BECKG1743D_GA0114223_101982 [Candidatus Kentron sp. G]|nr:MAG: hypothetical protein BECKG1743F_GA0114225_102262 [Candidatus Kentron sp. G]VFM98734.1 MAG: hypothetical protein BECKG1743E_GA0114224_102042 [Candidatus Kentron sp. G]VFN00473.1 MAG: hypothetical protein BECKG1743D_GA0114223_101982 [Candidatus Kentron sp. G]